ncbi:uncharacterized protein LOC105214996 [Zeugodacus cucurbitae]|uniref:tRNA uridine 5-carboxymethylaminomethyl modification enzyme MnmG n=1 Tax=Zeugodacus cucurbitae TaxID=28588 RepID=A0A0A1XAS9_ZEUCU|nr:uncharacterized protein LOC105214996 [Zeugodacus cucurbitae]
MPKMGDLSEQSTPMRTQVQATIIPKNAKIFTFNPCQRQPIKIIKCGVQKIEPADNTTEVISLLKTILNKQESIDQRMEQIEKSVSNTKILISKNINERDEIMARNQLIRECKVKVKRERTIGRTLEQIEKNIINEIAAGLPLDTMDAIAEVELKLSGKQYNKSMVTCLKKFKNESGSVDKVLRHVFSDTIIKNFNWDGRWGKEALRSLKMVDQILFELYAFEGRCAFEKQVKKYVELSHNRFKHKVRLANRIKQQHELLGYP